MEYYIGQIFEGKYPPEAAVWCNANNAYIDVIGDHRYEIKAVPPAPAPTKDDIKRMRIEYRHSHIDDQTLERNRKMANGTWTEEDETAYLALDAEVTAYIEENLPYPDEPTTNTDNEIDTTPEEQIENNDEIQNEPEQEESSEEVIDDSEKPNNQEQEQ